MEIQEIEKLKFRRQYLLTPEPIQCPFLHERRKISEQYYLYTHIDLKVEEYTRHNARLVLLGDMFDYDSPRKLNSDILRDLIDISIERVLQLSSKYSGRYVIIFIFNEQVFLFHDAIAAKKIFYSIRNNDYWFASQPHLLANVLNLSKTSDASKLSYYFSDDFIRSMNGSVGDTTYYDEIQQLIPNHYIKLNPFSIQRYWPDKVIETNSVKAVSGIISKMLKGYIESIASRYEIMLPLTAGKDSRTLLAASVNIKDKLFIYSNKHHKINDKSLDIVIPNKLLKKLGLKFNILDRYSPVDDDFRRIYYENNPFASPDHLSVIYNYYLNYSDKVNLPGNNVAEQEYIFNVVNKALSPDDLTELTGLGAFDFAGKYFVKWFRDTNDMCRKYNVNPMSLFYWENRLTNCILQYQNDKEIAQEEFNPFNSRLLISHYLSVKPMHLLSPDYKLHKRVMKNLWPEVLAEPINPSLSNKLKGFFKLLGLLKIVYTLKYNISHNIRSVGVIEKEITTSPSFDSRLSN